MTEMQRFVVLLSLLHHLKEKGNWCGELDIQRITYFLQELMEVPLGYNYILYQSSPFSFDLAGDITGLRADLLLTLKPDACAVRLLPSQESGPFLTRYPATREKYGRAIEFVAGKLGPKAVAELSLLGTAMLITLRELPEGTVAERIRRISTLKPYITSLEAEKALEEVDEMRQEAQAVIASTTAAPKEGSAETGPRSAQTPASGNGELLAREWTTFNREVDRLSREGQAGRFALVKGDAVISVWDTRRDAEQAARERFAQQPFLIQQIQLAAAPAHGDCTAQMAADLLLQPLAEPGVPCADSKT